VSLAYRERIPTVKSWPFEEIIHLIEVDRRECIGPERIEYALAAIGVICGRSQGMEIDAYDVLAMNPWSKAERPVLSDAQLAAQSGCILNPETGKYEDIKKYGK
jgi:hypothetical protein